jgi:crotonobetainyl-CoA:carnitine CoA-transferase CaiB-like acyl-CoA transferase
MLDGLSVLDLSTVLAGPSVGTFLAELGASVTKVEHPLHPDVTRSWRIPGEQGAVTSYFSSINFGKTYQHLSLTDANDKAQIWELLAKTDVLLMNFKSADYEKFGLTPESIRSSFPSLITATISGFGDDSDRVAYDLILQAESGFMAMNGTQDAEPLKMPVALIDVLAAHHLKEGILLALLQRQKTGQGAWLSVSLYDAAVCSLTNQASAYLMHGFIPQRLGSLHPNIAPYGEIFTSKEGKQLTFAIGSNRQFNQLCEMLGCPLLSSDPSFLENVDRVRNRKALAAALSPWIAKFEVSFLEHEAALRYIPMGRIKNMNEVFNSPKAQRLIRTEFQEDMVTHRTTQIAVQWK